MTDRELILLSQALADGTRLEMIRLLASGRSASFVSPKEACCPDGVCVCDLMAHLGMIQSRVSYHLRLLKAAGLVSETRLGRWNYYSLNQARLADFQTALATLGKTAPHPSGLARAI